MSDRERRLLEAKLLAMDGYLRELSGYRPADDATYLATSWRRRAVERMAQVLIEAMVDANDLLLLDSGAPPAASARESFDAMVDAGVLPADLAGRCRRMYVGLRNRLVHDYEALDDAAVFRATARLVDDVPRYIDAVMAHLRR